MFLLILYCIQYSSRHPYVLQHTSQAALSDFVWTTLGLGPRVVGQKVGDAKTGPDTAHYNIIPGQISVGAKGAI